METEIFLTSNDALKKIESDLKEEMAKYDRWASENPHKIIAGNQDFKTVKQKIKLLQLKRKELIDLHNNYQNTLMVSWNHHHQQTEPSYSKPRGVQVVSTKRQNMLGERRSNKISTQTQIVK
jgi:hypothetical protein